VRPTGVQSWWRTTALTFVIPTEAKRSGGICGSHNRRPILMENNHPNLCHPDRSEAQWRDLQFAQPASNPDGEQPPYPLSSRPERSAVEGSAVSRGSVYIGFIAR
jgi:hypothetical protein